MSKRSLHSSGVRSLASLPDRFVDPVELCQRVFSAAEQLPEIEIGGLDPNRLAQLAEQRPLTIEGYEKFTKFLCRDSKILGPPSVSSATGDQSRYTIGFEFQPGEHELGQGGIVRKSTCLLRDGESVLLSESVVTYATGFDDAGDYDTRHDKWTSLLQEDLLARAVLNLLRDEQSIQALASSALRVAICEVVCRPGVTFSSLERETGINHRTLSRLAEGENVQLHVSQIVALNDRLAERQSRFLTQRRLGDALAGCKDVRLLLPAYRDASDAHRRLCSPWDVLAADRIRAKLGKGSSPTRCTMQKVANEQEKHPALHTSPTTTSLFCIGSPRALTLCDKLLTRLATFGQQVINLPFCFYWKNYESESPHVLPEGKVAWSPWKDKLNGLRAAVLIDGEEPYREVSNLIDPTRNTFESYAIVAVRWINSDALLGCLAGLTGPASEAAGRLLVDLDFSVPRPDPGSSEFESPLVWYLIAAKIGVDPGDSQTDAKDDLRFLIEDGIRVVLGPDYLAPGLNSEPLTVGRPRKTK